MGKIEMQDLVKSYDGKINILEKINVNVREGELFVLVGPSGCGKSTLLRVIAGLEKITDGTLRIDGKVANNLLPKERELSMVFQNYALYPHMSVKENILFGLDVKKVPKEERQRRLEKAAELLGLTEYLNRKPRELSGGQRQRVALARSVCSQTPICLMDEPLSNLDAKLRSRMRSEICNLQKELGLTVVYVTHDQVEAMTMGNRIMVLNAGKVQQVGTPLELYNTPANIFVATFIGSPQMNIANARLEDQAVVLNDTLTVTLSPEEASQLPDGKEWKIGTRAEAVKLAAPDTPNAVAVTVANVEMMGNETQILFYVGDSLFTARLSGQYSIERNQKIYIRLDPAMFLFFDKESDKLLRPALRIKGQNVTVGQEA